MAIEIEKTFEVPQAVDDVWAFLTDPESIVQCLPGARLVEEVDERTVRGEIGMKLGPIGTMFKGVIHFEELDASRHYVVMRGEGKDDRGTGSVRMKMTSELSQTDDGGTHVWVSQTVSLTGKLASFGRGGVIQGVADLVFGRFTSCVQTKLAEAGEA
ncbi:MAG: SRPBCC family protein [Gemmatimonadota bacterium]|nr:SRPBCC family protein [Gemmatimonadota bacterium]